MAKRGLFVGNVTPFLRDISKKKGWALCVGAGTSLPAFPDWKTLITRLVARDVGEQDSPLLTQSLLSRYMPDALIQAAHDRLGLNDDEFAKVLSHELYSNITTKLDADEWDLFTQMISARLAQYTRADWRRFVLLIQKRFPNLSALAIAEVVSEYFDTDFAPSAILSFNAEPLIPSLINAYVRINRVTGSQASKALTMQMDLVTHSITFRNAKRTPYYFIHGLLPIPTPIRNRRIIDSTDKLVFSESEYLQLANTAFSWQSSIFLEIAATRSLVFVGVSLSDPNMRRWLTWIHDNRRRELERLFAKHDASTTHYWISVHPGKPDERAWIESSVAHLGVRLVWINEWSQVGEVLRSMLGSPS